MRTYHVLRELSFPIFNSINPYFPPPTLLVIEKNIELVQLSTKYDEHARFMKKGHLVEIRFHAILIKHHKPRAKDIIQVHHQQHKIILT